MSSNAGDFRQRYRGTYGYFIGKSGKRTLVQIAQVDLDSRSVRFLDRNDQDYTLYVDAEDNVGFEFLPPRPAWHNTSMGAVLVRRTPARQYQRGICNNNTSIMRADGGNLGVSFKVLHSIFDAQIEVAKAAEGRSFALTPQIAVDWDKSQIKVLDQVIGKAERSENGVMTITLQDSCLFRQEVQDGFNRAKMEAVIK